MSLDASERAGQKEDEPNGTSNSSLAVCQWTSSGLSPNPYVFSLSPPTTFTSDPGPITGALRLGVLVPDPGTPFTAEGPEVPEGEEVETGIVRR